MSTPIGILTALVSLAIVAAEAKLAANGGMLTVAQMKRSHPDHKIGLPFSWHFGMWGDVLLITPAAAWIVSAYGAQWELQDVAIVGIFALIASVVLHWFYSLSAFPDSLAWNGKITAAGYLHVAYTAGALAIVGLWYVFTEHGDTVSVAVVTAVLMVHVLVASKIFIGLLNRHWLHFDWCPMLLDQRDQWAIVAGAWALLATLAVRAVIA